MSRDTSSSDARINRRQAILKGAVGAGTVAAVWAAPKIEGTRLVPDYAAAGTPGTPVVGSGLGSNFRTVTSSAGTESWTAAVDIFQPQDVTFAGGTIRIAATGVATGTAPTGSYTISTDTSLPEGSGLLIPPGCTSCTATASITNCESQDPATCASDPCDAGNAGATSVVSGTGSMTQGTTSSPGNLGCATTGGFFNGSPLQATFTITCT